jgi:hypothetical protein
VEHSPNWRMTNHPRRIGQELHRNRQMSGAPEGYSA